MDDGKVEKVNCTNRRSYAWFICATSFLVQFLAMSFYGSFGPMYVEILRVFGEGDAKTGTILVYFFLKADITGIFCHMTDKMI